MKQDLAAQTDVATWLGRLADELRGGSLASSGAARQEGHSLRSLQYRTLVGIGGSLDRIADVLDSMAGRLCQSCRIKGVTENLSIEESLPRSHKRR